MFNIKQKAISALLFFSISLSANGIQSTPPFYTLTSVLVPVNFGTNQMNAMLYLLNCCVCLIFIQAILKSVDEQYLMNAYLLTRAPRQQVFKINLLRIFKDLALLLAVKMAIDLLFSQMKAGKDFFILLHFSVATFLTVSLWVLLAYCLRGLIASAKLNYFLLATLLFGSQFAALWLKPFTLIAIASPDYLKNPLPWLLIKLALLVAVGSTMYLLIRHHENKRKMIQTERKSHMITVENVTKVLSKKQVLTDINLVLEQGECVLLRGHNGCGKTMLLRLLCGLLQPTQGTVRYDQTYRFGVIIETPTFFPNESVLYNLNYLASINKLIDQNTIETFLKKVNLFEERNLKVRKLSLGMKQRLAICQAFMENPDVLLLDEPFNAIDDENLQIVYDLIKESCANGKLVVVAAHGEVASKDCFTKEYTMNNGKFVV